ncbi:MAG: BamA/TamA family outer membrane protein, partial [Gammaproteobacteria bacterium]|nr:BamA/TamA family outer membrane protein [Gammaproteobacteria bacterium]
VTVKQDPRGTGFIETGVDFAGDSDSSSIDLRLAYLKTDIDDLGSEFRTLVQVGENQALLVELYKPLEETLKLIALPRLVAERQTVAIFDEGGNKTSEVQIEQLGGSLALGREFWRHAALFAGVRRFTGDTEVEVGAPQANENFEGGEFFVNMNWDRLDDRYFPNSGTFARTEYLTSRGSLGASESFEQLDASALSAATWGRHTLLVGARYGTTFDGDAPVQSLFRAGGLFRLSGFQPDEISGSHFGMAFMGYRVRLFEQGFLPPYVGATVEYGNATDERDDIWEKGIFNGSAYVGFDSPLGPLYAGYGFAEGGKRGLLSAHRHSARTNLDRTLNPVVVGHRLAAGSIRTLRRTP